MSFVDEAKELIANAVNLIGLDDKSTEEGFKILNTVMLSYKVSTTALAGISELKDAYSSPDLSAPERVQLLQDLEEKLNGYLSE